MRVVSHPLASEVSLTTLQIITYTGDTIGFIIGSFSLIFLAPKIFKEDYFFIILSVISTFSIVVGLFAYAIGDYYILWVQVDTYTALEPFRYYNINIPALASIWGDANAMSKIALGGVIGSHYLFDKYKSNFLFYIVLLNLLGLFIANGTMAITALLLSYPIYIFYHRYGHESVLLYLYISATIGSMIFILVLSGVGIGTVIPKSIFSGRIEVWRAAVDTFFHHPILGVGIHNVGNIIAAYSPVPVVATPQNSYLRIFAAGGIIAGTLYLFIIVTTVFSYVQNMDQRLDPFLAILLISFLLVQFASVSGPFGINKNALIFSMAFGYVLHSIYEGPTEWFT